jgi:hypothetical protein
MDDFDRSREPSLAGKAVYTALVAVVNPPRVRKSRAKNP